MPLFMATATLKREFNYHKTQEKHQKFIFLMLFLFINISQEISFKFKLLRYLC